MKDHLIPTLVERDEVKYVIKRGSIYSCIATEKLKFLDVISYVAAGVNLDSFLKAYGADAPKSFFPYEYFDSLTKLDGVIFPRFEHFFSSLKDRNTLIPLENEKLTTEEARVIRRHPTESNPLTADEAHQISQWRYNELIEMFYENNWSLRDYLIFYNNRYGNFYKFGTNHAIY